MDYFTKAYRNSQKVVTPVLGLLVFVVLTACGTAQANSSVIQEVLATSQVSVESAELVAQPNAPEESVAQFKEQAESVPEQAPAAARTVNEAAATGMGGGDAPVADNPGAKSKEASAPDPAAPPAVEAQTVQELALDIKPEVGFLAPEFNLQTLDGQIIKLSDLRGRPVVVSYWATWCEPCKQELPLLQKISEEYAASGLQVITVDAIEQDNADNLQGLMGQLGITLPVLLDHQNQFQSAYKQLFFPTSYFIDPNGVIRFIKLGDAKEAELRSKVDQLVNDQL